MLVQITTPGFVADLLIRNGRVACADPHLSGTTGWTAQQLRDYALRKGWVVHATSDFGPTRWDELPLRAVRRTHIDSENE
jgi:hypothetical protein